MTRWMGRIRENIRAGVDEELKYFIDPMEELLDGLVDHTIRYSENFDLKNPTKDKVHHPISSFHLSLFASYLLVDNIHTRRTAQFN